MIPLPPIQTKKEHRVIVIHMDGEEINPALNKLCERLDDGWEIKRVDATRNTLVYIICMET
jgi:hypothetical protein